MVNQYNIDGCEKLCAAVIERAVSDYKLSLKRLKRNPNDTYAQKIVNDCERFFLDEVGIYSSLDGKTIMRIIREQVGVVRDAE